jgi:hypothetical protein
LLLSIALSRSIARHLDLPLHCPLLSRHNSPASDPSLSPSSAISILSLPLRFHPRSPNQKTLILPLTKNNEGEDQALADHGWAAGRRGVWVVEWVK